MKKTGTFYGNWMLSMSGREKILGFQSISREAADSVCHPHRLDPTMELKITYSFVLYLQHGHRDVKCKPSIDLVDSDFKGNDVTSTFGTFARTCC